MWKLCIFICLYSATVYWVYISVCDNSNLLWWLASAYKYSLETVITCLFLSLDLRPKTKYLCSTWNQSEFQYVPGLPE